MFSTFRNTTLAAIVAALGLLARGGVAPPRAPRSVREPLGSYGS
jgi:hypothetical protein